MRVLLTGAFGNIGQDVVPLLLDAPHAVRCFDVATGKNKRAFRVISEHAPKDSSLHVVWGDIREPADVRAIVKDVDAILHLAAIIPPASERDPDVAHQINVEGTRALVRAAQEQDPPPKFIFTSSVSVYGPCMTLAPPRKADEVPNPTDSYTRHKVACEEMLRESELPWTILRVAAVLIKDAVGGFDPIIFEIPLEQRIEVVHSRDMALACVNCVHGNVTNKILLIGGGNSCQMLQRDFITRLMDVAGVGALPDAAFRMPKNDSDWYYTDFVDSEEAQQLLNYQRHTFDDYLEELREALGARRHIARIFRPGTRFLLSALSPYYRRHLKTKLGMR